MTFQLTRSFWPDAAAATVPAGKTPTQLKPEVKTGSNPTFAFVLHESTTEVTKAAAQAETAEQKAQAHMKKRVAEVGLMQYTKEQGEVKRLTRVLEIIRADAPEDVHPSLEELMQSFRDDPADSGKDMMARINTWVESLPDGTENSLRKRMQELVRIINELMSKSDDELARLEKHKGNNFLS